MSARAAIHQPETVSPLAALIVELSKANAERNAAADALQAAQKRALVASKHYGEIAHRVARNLSPGESIAVKVGPAEAITFTRPESPQQAPIIQRSRLVR